MNIYLNIGTNSGDRRANIARAVAAIVSAFPGCRCHLSAPVQSEPWGYASTNRYLNIGLHLHTRQPLTPRDVLDRTQAVERTVGTLPHRNPDGTYRDRDIDIDIIAIDTVRIDTPELTIPHPRAALRPFVTDPMHDFGAEGLIYVSVNFSAV